MKAIVYTSNTGHTAAYAKMLSEKTHLPIYTLKEAIKQLSRETEVFCLSVGFLPTALRDIKRQKNTIKFLPLCAVGLL